MTANLICRAVSSPEEPQPSLPCDTFICLLEKFEVLKTPNGFLLKDLHTGKPPMTCTTFQCWLGQFKISERSYGFQLDDGKNNDVVDNNRFQQIFKSTIKKTTAQEKLPDYFYDMLYHD